MNILLGITGSVAAIKTIELHSELSKLGDVKVVATKSALNIVEQIRDQDTRCQLIDNLPISQGKKLTFWGGGIDILTDEQEWLWMDIGDPVLHIELKDWANVFVIAPLTANTLAKMANGICDNLLTCIYRAYPITKPIIVAPAMNTDMWEHPITTEQLNVLWERHFYRHYDKAYNYNEVRRHNFTIVYPVSKKLACGTVGMGAMAGVKDIAEMVKACLK